MGLRVALRVWAMGLLPLSATAAWAQPPVVIELFTSQGCSSCPPADAVLTDLARQRPDVLPLAFHVTYWNDLGWKDPFSFDAATLRQEAYARSLGGELYTPEMVVNGSRGFVGSRRAEALSQIADAMQGAAPAIPISLTRAGPVLTAAVGAGAGDAQVLLVGFDPEHQTSVGRGENGGRRLLESNIVRSLTAMGRWTGSSADFRLGAPAGERFAVLLQAADGRILAAARLGPAS